MLALALLITGTVMALQVFGETRRQCYEQCQKQRDDCIRAARQRAGKDTPASDPTVITKAHIRLNDMMYDCEMRQLRCQRACDPPPGDNVK